MQAISQNEFLFLFVVIMWVLPWKIYSVWTAARRGEMKWFLALLILNTFAILDIIYVFYIAQKSWADVQRVFQKKVF